MKTVFQRVAAMQDVLREHETRVTSRPKRGNNYPKGPGRICLQSEGWQEELVRKEVKKYVKNDLQAEVKERREASKLERVRKECEKEEAKKLREVQKAEEDRIKAEEAVKKKEAKQVEAAKKKDEANAKKVAAAAARKEAAAAKEVKATAKKEAAAAKKRKADDREKEGASSGSGERIRRGGR